MTRQEAYDYIVDQLAVPVNSIVKFLNAFSKVLDFITESTVSAIIPDWTAALTFNTDGTGDGRFCTHEDTDGKKRIFETKTDANINNEPPTNPLVTENTNWKEISQSSGSSIKEWAVGVYGSGLVIVYHNHSVNGGGLYKLLNPSRPFASSNIETEITAGDWEKIITNEADPVVKRVKRTVTAAELLDLFTTPIELIAAPGAGKLIKILSTSALYKVGTVPYTLGAGTTAVRYGVGGSDLFGTLINTILGNVTDRLAITSSISSAANEPSRINTAITLVHGVQNPTDGDGTLVLALVYEIIDFN